MAPKTEADFDQIIAEHIEGACFTAGDDDLFADACDPDEILGDRSDWGGWDDRNEPTDREWDGLYAAAERWIAEH